MSNTIKKCEDWRKWDTKVRQKPLFDGVHLPIRFSIPLNRFHVHLLETKVFGADLYEFSNSKLLCTGTFQSESKKYDA